jgi:LPS-assembly lipoprotein
MKVMDRRLSLILACSALLALAGCGFRPLYGTAQEDRGVAAALASISIPEPEERLDQLIRNDLLSTMRPVGTVSEDRYTLILKPELSTTDIIDKSLSKLDTQRPVTERKQARLTVSYELAGNRGEGTVTSGKTFSQVSYDVVRQPVADLQAETNAIERAAHEVSADIRTRLAAYFASL